MHALTDPLVQADRCAVRRLVNKAFEARRKDLDCPPQHGVQALTRRRRLRHAHRRADGQTLVCLEVGKDKCLGFFAQAAGPCRPRYDAGEADIAPSFLYGRDELRRVEDINPREGEAEGIKGEVVSVSVADDEKTAVKVAQGARPYLRRG